MSDNNDMQFKSAWYVWVHDADTSVWTDASYTHIYTINNMQTFWQFMNNFDKYDIVKYQYFIFKDSSFPNYEHPTNRNGGKLSIKVNKEKTYEIFEQLCILIFNETFTNDHGDINGLQIGFKGNWTLIKIWNSKAVNEQVMLDQLPSYLYKRYTQPVVNIRYFKNEPEW